jgi:predicted kinase
MDRVEDVPRSPLGRSARLYVLTGIPGSGKSTYARNHLGRCVRVSLDDLRKMMSGRDYHAEYEPMVAEAGRAVLEALLSQANVLGFDVVLDATNVTRAWRGDAIARARRHGVEPYSVFVDVPFEVAARRNAARGRVVPDAVLQRFHCQLEPPHEDEGFVEVIRVG